MFHFCYAAHSQMQLAWNEVTRILTKAHHLYYVRVLASCLGLRLKARKPVCPELDREK
jgi:hypothetical protein